MTIEKIGLVMATDHLQTVYDKQNLTALEVAAAASAKVDECVELVNGVSQIAAEASSVVDEMHETQNNLIIETNDLMNQLPLDVTTQVNTKLTEMKNDGSIETILSGSFTPALLLKAPIESPTFTGVPKVPTAEIDTNTDQAASTSFVINQDYIKTTDAKVIDGGMF